MERVFEASVVEETIIVSCPFPPPVLDRYHFLEAKAMFEQLDIVPIIGLSSGRNLRPLKRKVFEEDIDLKIQIETLHEYEISNWYI